MRPSSFYDLAGSETAATPGHQKAMTSPAGLPGHHDHDHEQKRMERADAADAAALAAAAASSSSSSGLDIQMENDWEYVHGRVDPGIEDSIDMVEGVVVTAAAQRAASRHRNAATSWTGNQAESREASAQFQTLHAACTVIEGHRGCFLTALPSELIDHILSFLGPIDLVSVSTSSRLLSAHARSDLAWQRHVQENVPGLRLTSPAPYDSYRELYIAHDPHWFLTKYKIWFSDYFLSGKLIVTRYDPRRACIEGYRLVAERPPPSFDTWDADDEVVVHSFDPTCRLHLDEPDLQLNPTRRPHGKAKEHIFSAETRMPIGTPESGPQGLFSNFLLARHVEVRPSMQLWPPPTIPARERVRNASQEGFIGIGHRPQKRSEVCDQAFRIRRWMEMAGRRSAPGVHMGEEVNTYATLDPKLYTPTEDKPYRGIWVGDYSGHGCEFLLMNQPDDEEPFDESTVIQMEDETTEEWEVRKKEVRINRGSIEAIKLTGDPNIPRGEYTFVADDISDDKLIRVATEDIFKGARIVQSRGHIAARMFRNNKYIESQLIMISHNRLAQYWVGFGHISYFERVNIDDFLSPTSTPGPATRPP